MTKEQLVKELKALAKRPRIEYLEALANDLYSEQANDIATALLLRYINDPEVKEAYEAIAASWV